MFVISSHLFTHIPSHIASQYKLLINCIDIRINEVKYEINLFNSPKFIFTWLIGDIIGLIVTSIDLITLFQYIYIWYTICLYIGLLDLCVNTINQVLCCSWPMYLWWRIIRCLPPYCCNISLHLLLNVCAGVLTALIIFPPT